MKHWYLRWVYTLSQLNVPSACSSAGKNPTALKLAAALYLWTRWTLLPYLLYFHFSGTSMSLPVSEKLYDAHRTRCAKLDFWAHCAIIKLGLFYINCRRIWSNIKVHHLLHSIVFCNTYSEITRSVKILYPCDQAYADHFHTVFMW